MPCHDPTPREESQLTKEKLDNLTALVCSYCKILEKYDRLNFLSKDLNDWWKEHKIYDARNK